MLAGEDNSTEETSDFESKEPDTPSEQSFEKFRGLCPDLQQRVNEAQKVTDANCRVQQLEASQTQLERDRRVQQLGISPQQRADAKRGSSSR